LTQIQNVNKIAIEPYYGYFNFLSKIMSLSVREAKDSLSEVIRLAESGQPQIIKRHDREVAVIVSINQWKQLQGKRKALVEVLRKSPMVGVELDFSRPEDLPRDVDFS
jgi:prevent-host-death family protein